MANECCFGKTPPLEKLRNLCITCLVLDAIFVLINGLYTLTSTSTTTKTVCYEAHGYNWHNMVTLSFAISTGVAASGMMVHSAISCGTQAQMFQIVNITRYAYILIGWTFMSAVMETLAYKEEPEQCKDRVGVPAAGGGVDQNVADAEASKHALWQIVYTMLSLAWITVTVASSIFGRRLLREWSEDEEGGSNGAEATQQVPPVQTFGWSAQMPPGASGTTVVSGAPMSGPPGAGGEATGWPTGAVGGEAFPGVVVAQGRPVPGSTHDPERPPPSAVKVVD